jgi:hypothetical protein
MLLIAYSRDSHQAGCCKMREFPLNCSRYSASAIPDTAAGIFLDLPPFEPILGMLIPELGISWRPNWRAEGSVQ